ncbi:response regulator [Salipiger sp. IMCC34102]|uniref:response regulator n=1 Tax=Salipiger sp. IMCC34102 TaxID=2510647 RepID=UPI00101C7E06|nr:response regulator [Salipiger sp. IMCC34102]RYH01909.1 response regulator [Salipiger sp. IMCC34102]
MDDLRDYMVARPPTALRPLLGVTVLIVEDSRYTCEAVRLMCMRSGARIRRANSLCAAMKHLSIYRPGVVIVDIGLPDGSGLDLIRQLSEAQPRIEVIFATSGDPDLAASAVEAGADAFLTKPFGSIAEFQTAILSHLPKDRHPPGPRAVTAERVRPDPLAYHDDLQHVATLLERDTSDVALEYAIQFLQGLAVSAEDHELLAATEAVRQPSGTTGRSGPHLSRLTALVRARLERSKAAL